LEKLKIFEQIYRQILRVYVNIRSKNLVLKMPKSAISPTKSGLERSLMITVASFTPGTLNQKRREEYQKLANSEWYQLLDSPPTQSTLFVGLENEGRPLGLCICSFCKLYGYCDFSFLHLQPEIETSQNYLTLFHYCAEKARMAGIRYLTIHYPLSAGGSETPLIQALNAMEWRQPILWSQTLEFDCRTFHPDWLHTTHSTESRFQIFPWIELTEKEATQVKNHIEQYNLSEYLSPFYHLKYQQSANSIGLRNEEGKVVGWVITHTYPDQPAHVHYSCFYIHPEFQRLPISIQLLREAICLQQKSTLPYSIFDVSIRDSDATWLKFINKRLAPHALQVTNFVQQKFIL